MIDSLIGGFSIQIGEIATQRREVADVEKKIHDVQNHLVRLDTLIHKETGTEDTLANDNILRENEFMYSLKVTLDQPVSPPEGVISLCTTDTSIQVLFLCTHSQLEQTFAGNVCLN